MKIDRVAILALCSFCFAMAFIPRCGFGQDIDAEKVRRSIDQGVRFLKSQQNTDGSWQGLTGQKDGSSALITLALLNSGVPNNDKSIVKALRYLGNIKPESMGTYTVSLRIMVYAIADPAKYKSDIQKDVAWLKRAQNQTGNVNDGAWSYLRNAGGSGDASNAQFALLALHEASMAGVKVDPEIWRRAKQYWLRVFDRGQGAFKYNTGESGCRGSMTCAGISSMIIIHENLAAEMDEQGMDVQCCGGSMRPESIDQAIAWMSDDIHFRVTGNPFFPSYRTGNFHDNSKYYYLYGLERAGRLAGIRFFGQHDWYREGAEHLIKIQNAGSWRARAGTESNPQIATSLALLFLAKGKRPVVLGKYRYGRGGNWDTHTKGVHYLTRKIERAWKRKLNWQVVDGRSATVDDLLEAPVLFISGRDEINLDENQKKALREYIENGGFIFAEACQGDGCGEDVPFDKSFRALMKEVIPGSRFDLLPVSHPIWQAHYQLKEPSANRPVLGIQASCRTSVVYVPANMSGLWQLNQPGRFEKHNDGAKKDIEFTTKLGVNVIAYATNRELKAKLDRPKVTIDSSKTLGSRILEIPKLNHGGGADDAPNAWRNMLSRLRFDRRRPVKLEKKFVSADIEEMQGYPIIFLHGRAAFKFDDEQRAAIKEYLNRGGFIFADSICSSAKFSESFRKEMKEIFPESKLETIPKDDSIWKSSAYTGYDIKTVTLRSPITNDRGETFRSQKTHPLVEGIKIKGRYGVIFSPYDLSCAMENASGSQCKGYNKDDAARIAVNIVLYALIQIPTDQE